MKINQAVAAAACCALASCVSPDPVRKTQFYELAVSMAPLDQPHPVMLVESHDSVPAAEMVPYAMITCLSTASGENAGASLWMKAVPHRPDLVSYEFGGDVATGSVSQYWGWGIATSTPTYSHAYTAWCFRATEAVLPFKLNRSGMILEIDPSEASCGLLEGDTIVSVNGGVYDEKLGVNSSWFGMRLSIHPGNEIDVQAIRPGTGRISAK